MVLVVECAGSLVRQTSDDRPVTVPDGGLDLEVDTVLETRELAIH